MEKKAYQLEISPTNLVPIQAKSIYPRLDDKSLEFTGCIRSVVSHLAYSVYINVTSVIPSF